MIPNIFSSAFIILDVRSIYLITNSGLIQGSQHSGRDRQTAFFTTVNRMQRNYQDRIELDVTKQRHASYEKKWKKTPRYGVLGRCSACSTEKTEIPSNKIVRSHPMRTFPAYCISKAIVMKSEEITCHRRRFLTMMIGRAMWILMFQEAKGIQRIEPKPYTTGRLVTQ